MVHIVLQLICRTAALSSYPGGLSLLSRGVKVDFKLVTESIYKMSHNIFFNITCTRRWIRNSFALLLLNKGKLASFNHLN